MAIDEISAFFRRNKSEETHGQQSGQEELKDQIVDVPLDLLKPNPFQPRKQFDPMQMEELSRSIAEVGVIQPIVIRKVEDNYEIVAGERRWRAARIAGLPSIPSIIRKIADTEMAEIALVENLQRADLSYFEEAEGYRRLIEDFHMTQEEVAKKVGKSQPTVANKLRLLRMDPDIKEMIWVDVLSERHVRAMLRLKTVEDQITVLKEIYERELNVKETEEMINTILEGRFPVENREDDVSNDSKKTDEKRQTITKRADDLRIYINTIREAVSTIIDSGMKVTVEQVETDECVRLTITIPRIKQANG